MSAGSKKAMKKKFPSNRGRAQANEYVRTEAEKRKKAPKK